MTMEEEKEVEKKGEKKGREDKPEIELKDEALEELKERFPGVITDDRLQRERRLVATVDKESLVEVCKYLRDSLDFDHLSSISGVDYEGGYEVVYHLWSYSRKKLIALRVKLSKRAPSLRSVTSIWRSANWHERETYDLFGIKFKGHPNLTRILLDKDFEGHPFRKNYKLVEHPWHEDVLKEKE